MHLRDRFVVQSVTMALLAGLLGFSYALATQNEAQASATKAEPRAVGTSTLRILNPVYAPIPTDYDLGDALYGTAITRFVTATGGLRPYNFSANITNLGLNSTLACMTSGCIMGSASFQTTVTALAFNVFVTGSTETDINKTPVPSTNRTFHLNLFATSANLFRFASDHLNSGILGQAYISKMDVIGAKGVSKISILSGSITLNGAQVGTGSSLEETVGLSISSDGTVYGRPLRTGLVSFKAHAIDSLNRVAKDRTNSVPDQTYTFNIENSNVTGTDCTILSVSVKGNTAIANTDTLKFQAFMNLSGVNTTNLTNQHFSLVFGGQTYSGYMNNLGVVGTQLGGPLIFPDGTQLIAKVDSVNGTIKGMLKFATLSAGLGAANIVNRTNKRTAISIHICNLIVASDTLDLAATHIGTKYTLTYTAGHVGQTLGGTFQVYDVRGSDGLDIAGNPADAWTMKFLVAPRYGVDDSAGFTAINSIGVRIGTKFSQIIPFTSLKTSSNGSINLATKGLGASVNKLQINGNSFSGMIMTNPLSINTTGLPQAVDATTAATNFFNLALDINRVAPNTSFNGEDAKFILKVPVFRKWVDRNTKKPKP